jgi:pyocin large subunit-like protein
MSTERRRTRTGLPLAVLIAILTAVFGSRLSHRPAPLPDARAQATAPSSAPTRSVDPRDTRPSAPASSTRDGSPEFTTRAHLVEHFEKHGSEFPGLDMAAYLRAAQTLRDQPAGGDVLELRRRDGVVTRFDKASGAFVAVNRDGTIRTFFRPNDGEAYFRRQATRDHGGGA